VVDVTAPTATFTPNHTTGELIDTTLTITFDEDVVVGTGNININKSGVGVVETIDAASLTVSVSNTVVVPHANFDFGSDYYITIDAGAFEDLSGNDYAGISGTGDWAFSTIAPLAATFNPNAVINVSVNTNLLISFNRNVTLGSGNINIFMFGGGLVESINVGSGRVTVSGSTVTIDPVNTLGYDTVYYVEVDNGALKDLHNYSYSGVVDVTGWNFTTEGAPVVPPTPETPTPTPVPLTIGPEVTETPTETVTPTETTTTSVTTPSETIPTETLSVSAPVIETNGWTWWYTMIIIVALLLLLFLLLFFWRRKKNER